MNVSKPHRASHGYTQRLLAPPSVVLPLLCPVREAQWLDGWAPIAVYSVSGVAEPDCVFTTPADGREAVWVVTRHDPAAGAVEMIKVTPGVTACRLEIALRPDAVGSAADIRYTHTSLGPEGDAFVDAFTAEAYAAFMQDWEARLNHFLVHGVARLG